MLAGKPIRALIALHTMMAATVASCQTDPNDGRPAVAPPASVGHALVYHDSLGAVLLVNAGLGGMNDSQQANEPTRIWAWRNHRWTVIDSSGPPVRNLAGVAYDSRRNRLVIHGGSSALGVTLGETWEWGDGQWMLRTGPGPGPRDHTAMAYDRVRGRTVLFGGQVSLDSFPPTTWEWDGNTWLVAATGGPPARVHHGMTFDSASGRVIVYGGYQPNVRDLGDLWSWDGTQWTPLGQGAIRTHLVLSYHGGLGTVVAVGGLHGNVAAPLLSALQNHQWVAEGGTGPRGRYLAGAAYDVSRRMLVLFGGGDPAGMDRFADTWEHDGTGWTRRD
jgi:hypothetical protein